MTAKTTRPLFQKLNLKSDFNVALIDAPESYCEYIEGLDIQFTRDPHISFDWVHIFSNSYEILEKHIASSRSKIQKNGMIWVSWYKKSSRKQQEVNEDIIREIAFKFDLVDIKVCSVDNEWSALKFVIRKHLR